MQILKMLKKKAGIADFSEVVSVSMAREMAMRGELEPLYLIGLRFGGAEDLGNCVFVPVGIAAIKDQYDDVIEDLLREGRIKSYSCVPEYKGRSAVPYRLTMKASSPEGKPEFTETINIW